MPKRKTDMFEENLQGAINNLANDEEKKQLIQLKKKVIKGYKKFKSQQEEDKENKKDKKKKGEDGDGDDPDAAAAAEEKKAKRKPFKTFLSQMTKLAAFQDYVISHKDSTLATALIEWHEEHTIAERMATYIEQFQVIQNGVDNYVKPAKKRKQRKPASDSESDNNDNNEENDSDARIKDNARNARRNDEDGDARKPAKKKKPAKKVNKESDVEDPEKEGNAEKEGERADEKSQVDAKSQAPARKKRRIDLDDEDLVSSSSKPTSAPTATNGNSVDNGLMVLPPTPVPNASVTPLHNNGPFLPTPVNVSSSGAAPNSRPTQGGPSAVTTPSKILDSPLNRIITNATNGANGGSGSGPGTANNALINGLSSDLSGNNIQDPPTALLTALPPSPLLAIPTTAHVTPSHDLNVMQLH